MRELAHKSMRASARQQLRIALSADPIQLQAPCTNALARTCKRSSIKAKRTAASGPELCTGKRSGAKLILASRSAIITSAHHRRRTQRNSPADRGLGRDHHLQPGAPRSHGRGQHTCGWNPLPPSRPPPPPNPRHTPSSGLETGFGRPCLFSGAAQRLHRWF